MSICVVCVYVYTYVYTNTKRCYYHAPCTSCVLSVVCAYSRHISEAPHTLTHTHRLADVCLYFISKNIHCELPGSHTLNDYMYLYLRLPRRGVYLSINLANKTKSNKCILSAIIHWFYFAPHCHIKCIYIFPLYSRIIKTFINEKFIKKKG